MACMKQKFRGLAPVPSDRRDPARDIILLFVGMVLTYWAFPLQDLYHQPFQKLVDVAITAYQDHPNMNLEVFVHKADVLTEEYKIGLSNRHVRLIRCTETLPPAPRF